MNIDVANIFLYHSLVIFGELLVILVFVHMIYKQRTPTSIIAWMLSMILFPYIAIILYFIFGSRKLGDKYIKEPIKLHKRTHTNPHSNAISDVLSAHGISDATYNETFELYTNPLTAYEALMSSIDSAKESIYISTYIFNYDEITKNIIDALVKKSKDGVEIKILIDSLGSIESYILQNRLKALKDSGVKVEFFMPILNMPFRNYINLRNHRKIFIFDNKKVLSGGLNISKEYFTDVNNRSTWEDILFLIEGPSVEQYLEIFASDWLYTSEEQTKFTYSSNLKNGNNIVQVVPSGPDMLTDPLYEALLCAFYTAKERIWIVTPYFIPDRPIMQALTIAKNKGLDVRLITPKKTNHFLINLARGSYIRELQEVGIDVYLYDCSMLHAKAILFDSSISMLGSVNLDNRSLFLNYEVATFVYTKKVIEDVELWMNKLIDNSSTKVQEISTLRTIVENSMRMLAPQL